MLGKGTVRAKAQQCMHIPSCCWEQLCGSPPATAFQSSQSVELSFQSLFWPCSFFCHPVRASKDWNDEYYELPDSNCCHDAVLMPSLLPVWHCIEPASELIAHYQIACMSSAESERKALPQADNFLFPLFRSTWGVDLHSKILAILLNQTPWHSPEASGLLLSDINLFHAGQKHRHLQSHADHPSEGRSSNQTSYESSSAVQDQIGVTVWQNIALALWAVWDAKQVESISGWI